MKKNKNTTKIRKVSWKELGMIAPSSRVVAKNTAIVVIAMGGMAAFVFAADTITTWLLTAL